RDINIIKKPLLIDIIPASLVFSNDANNPDVTTLNPTKANERENILNAFTVYSKRLKSLLSININTINSPKNRHIISIARESADTTLIDILKSFFMASE